MSGHLATPDPVVAGALLLAATNDLQARLDGLAAEAAAIADGTAIVHLLDAEDGVLRPAAAHPIDQANVPEIELAGRASIDGAAMAARDRREVTSGEAGHASSLVGAAPGATTALHIPLVLERTGESPDVEGTLTLVGRTPTADPATLDALRGLAALAALAASQARLEASLGERSDWFDRLAHTDPLTGLANRRTFDRVLELELARAARQGTELCVAIFGVDEHDRRVEQHGAHAADDVLRRVAASLAETVRLVDTVARFGRAEFVVVAPGSSGMAMAHRAAAVVGAMEPPEGQPPVSVSVGVAAFPAHGTSSDELLAAAEAALDDARRQGGAVVGAG
jgi:two-component system cell cycle response regulator